LAQLLRIVLRSRIFLDLLIYVAGRSRVDALRLLDQLGLGLLGALAFGIERLIGHFPRTVI
jgi:hypothetical protein